MCHLAVADLLFERFGPVVDVGIDPGVPEKLLYLGGVLILIRDEYRARQSPHRKIVSEDAQKGQLLGSRGLGEEKARMAYTMQISGFNGVRNESDAGPPFTTKMFGNDRDEPLQAAQDCTMNHHRTIDLTLVLVGTSVFEIESLRKLEVELNGSALMRTSERILDGDVYLRAVEGTIASVELPFAWLESLKGIA